jgi:hypothetical protein
MARRRTYRGGKGLCAEGSDRRNEGRYARYKQAFGWVRGIPCAGGGVLFRTKTPLGGALYGGWKADLGRQLLNWKPRPNSGPKRKEGAIVTLGTAKGTARTLPIEGPGLAFQGRNSRRYQIALSWQEPGLCTGANCARETAVGICCGRGRRDATWPLSLQPSTSASRQPRKMRQIGLRRWHATRSWPVSSLI